CAFADHGWSHHRAVALHRTRSGSGDPAAAAEDQLARSTATKDHCDRRFRCSMIMRPVVPTLATAPTKNQLLGQFLAASSERRVKSLLPLLHAVFREV